MPFDENEHYEIYINDVLYGRIFNKEACTEQYGGCEISYSITHLENNLKTIHIRAKSEVERFDEHMKIIQIRTDCCKLTFSVHT